ncbi:MAG: hypothetical protein AAFR62_18430 [Cyanobacteria bacterium J06629_2]
MTTWSKEDLASLKAAADEFIVSRQEDSNYSAEDRQDYQLILSAYQNYLESDRHYSSKFTTVVD